MFQKMSKITKEGVMAVINAGKEDVDALKGIYASKSCLKDGFKSDVKLQGEHSLVVVRFSPFLHFSLF